MAQGASVEDGTFDTSLIKGKTSLAEIVEATGIPASEITAEWGVTADEQEQPMSEIKDEYGFTPEDIRAWVEERIADVVRRGGSAAAPVQKLFTSPV